MTQTGGETIERALARVDAALLTAPVLEAVLARREASNARGADGRHAAALAHELVVMRDRSGSWGRDLVRTGEALLLLHALAPEPGAEVAATVAGGVSWILGRKGLPGAFAEGCTPQRHALRFCEHFVHGFFSPGPPSIDLSGLTLSSGVRFGGDAAARLGASCVALRALLRWGDQATGVADHIDAVRVILTGVALNAQSLISAAAYVSAAAALAEAPRSTDNDAAIASALDRLAALQRQDGSWRGVDTFHVLQMMLAAAARGHRTPAAETSLRRAAGMLAVLQREDGQWGRETGPERTLTGWRTLRYVLGADGDGDGRGP